MKISYGLVLWTETFVYEASVTFVYKTLRMRRLCTKLVFPSFIAYIYWFTKH